MFLGMSQSEADDTGWRGTNEGSKLAGNAYLWIDGNLDQNIEFGTSGFAGLPAGIRNYIGNYNNMSTVGYFWSSSASNSFYAWIRYLTNNNSDVYRSLSDKVSGYPVCCVRRVE